MTREIKFRAWDKIAKCYLYPWPNGFNILGETTCFDIIGMQLAKRNSEQTTLEKLNDVEIEQFTGLHDKNGKEIYEGDITNVLEYLNGEIWEGHCHNAKIVFAYGGFTIKPCWCHQSINQEMKVIGNIHENPELLEESHNDRIA